MDSAFLSAFTTSSGSSISAFLIRSAIDRIKFSRLIFEDKKPPEWIKWVDDNYEIGKADRK